MTGFDKMVYDVYSEKNDVHGQIVDYGVVTKLRFTYDGVMREIGIKRPFPDNGQEAFEKLGADTIDSYIEKLLSKSMRRLMLHYWYVNEDEDKDTGEKFYRAHGIVTGHDRLADTTDIHTSSISDIKINDETGEAEIQTRNNCYYCPLVYCDYDRQDENPDLIPDYDKIKAKYRDSKVEPTIEQGNVLLVLSNFDEFYFHSLHYQPLNGDYEVEYRACAHIGTFQDSYLVCSTDCTIDIRYFPHYQNIEFYSQQTDGRPFFIENIGDVPLYAKTYVGTICLNPGERKEVAAENAEDESPILPDGDLYPAGIME